MPHPGRPATARGEATRAKLLDAAEHEFGEKGYHAASVASITRRAGVAQGTFYLYFPGKEDTMRELVRHMGRMLRRTLAAAAEGAQDRLDAERLGFQAFVRFACEHENLYRVVMESQFVDEAIYREYYEGLARRYADGLAAARDRGEIHAGDPEAQAWALMGVAHFLGLRAIWAGGRPDPAQWEGALAFVHRALAPEASAADEAAQSGGTA
ncbi:MAG: TetR/AcrR family transcriptional regulator [Trueperaceae bacterium]|nr:TetR/AcrR family transcriptional regulator [Trueperaceae bacterium]